VHIADPRPLGPTTQGVVGHDQGQDFAIGDHGLGPDPTGKQRSPTWVAAHNATRAGLPR
jgi:hypothetical protein